MGDSLIRRAGYGLTCLVVPCLLFGTGCAEEAGSTILPPLSIMAVGPIPILPGTALIIDGTGFLPLETAQTTVRIVGKAGVDAVDLLLSPTRESETRLIVSITPGVAPLIIRDSGVFQGQVIVQRQPFGDAPLDQAALPVQLPVAHSLWPTVHIIEPTELFPGDTLSIGGDGFLHAAEGVSLVVLDGRYTTDTPVVVQDIVGLEVPAVPPEPNIRSSLALPLTPDIFGIRPGYFEGTVRVRNLPLDGMEASSQHVDPGRLFLRPPKITEVSPLEGSRGQRVDVTGRGLVVTDGLLQAGTLLVLEGHFAADRGPDGEWEGMHARVLFPSAQIGNTLAQVVLRADLGPDGKLEGLGAAPGVFEGTIAPRIFSGHETVTGEALPLTFTVLAPKQVVFLHLLPAFDDALYAFGLQAERDAVVARILEVVQRDYTGINVSFAFEPPDDFVEYCVVEIGGNDPNGTGLFGLDNTSGKDVGNLRFDDVIGGFNAETRAAGYAAYGGIFAAELMNFSPSLSSIDLTSPRFDHIFGHTSPLLGGKPAEVGESAHFDSRALAILEAVRVMGNLVGNTVGHEVGHTLGLSAIDGQFHNVGNNPGWIMDAGGHRPFEERAEIDGQGPGFFSPFNRAYLEEILPL